MSLLNQMKGAFESYPSVSKDAVGRCKRDYEHEIRGLRKAMEQDQTLREALLTYHLAGGIVIEHEAMAQILGRLVLSIENRGQTIESLVAEQERERQD